MENEQNSYNLNELAYKWLSGTITNEEKVYYDTWYQNFDDTKTSILNVKDSNPDEMYSRLVKRLEAELQADKLIIKKNAIPLYQLLIAACVLVFLSIGTYVWINTVDKQKNVRDYTVITPGSNKAILTLANGINISLTDAKKGLLVKQGKVTVDKTEDGMISYHADPQTEADQKIDYNIITTPRSGQYHLSLPDGSNVWLNSSSSIRYPTTFSGSMRQVDITGEVYFEVKHSEAKPFIVKSRGQSIEVLGTHFNVNAYADELAVVTTLLQGSVKITQPGVALPRILKPGQQSALEPSGLSVQEANVEEAVAWKNGYFRFNDENIESIMRKLSRWYNIDITYEGKIPKEGLYGTISRSKNINAVLEMLQQTQIVHFKIAGRRVIVMA